MRIYLTVHPLHVQTIQSCMTICQMIRELLKICSRLDGLPNICFKIVLAFWYPVSSPNKTQDSIAVFVSPVVHCSNLLNFKGTNWLCERLFRRSWYIISNGLHFWLSRFLHPYICRSQRLNVAILCFKKIVITPLNFIISCCIKKPMIVLKFLIKQPQLFFNSFQSSKNIFLYSLLQCTASHYSWFLPNWIW